MMMPGMEEMGMNLQDMMSNFMPKKRSKRKLSVKEAREVMKGEEAEKLIDHDEVSREARLEGLRSRASSLSTNSIRSQAKTAAAPTCRARAFSATSCPSSKAPRSTLATDRSAPTHVLFIAAGAFNVSKPSDLIPELQGPISDPRRTRRAVRERLPADPDQTPALADQAVHRTSRGRRHAPHLRRHRRRGHRRI